MKNNCHNLIFVDSFVHGELGKDELERFENHIVSCEECRNEIDSLRKLKGLINTSHSYHLDGTFNYRVVNNLRKEKHAEERKEIRIAFEDIIISLATLVAIFVLGIQLFNRPAVSPFEMSGTLTNIEKRSMDQASLSNDQVLELVFQQKSDEPQAQGSK